MKTKIKIFILSTVILSGVLFLVTGLKNDVSGKNGISSAIPAYYDGKIFTIIFVEFPPKAEETLIAKNGQINFIYQYDPGLPGGAPFISVIDAVPGDGMNPLWEEVQLNFINGNAPRQFFSDNEVLDAVTNGIISLTFTGELYKCPVIGHK